jgi:hypothetical protein
LVKDKNGDLLADFHSVVSRRKKYFCRLLKVFGVNFDKQTEVHITESLIYEPSPFEFGIAIRKFKNYKSPDIHNISAEMIKKGGDMCVLRSTNLLILLGIRKNYHGSEGSLLLYLFIKRVIK